MTQPHILIAGIGNIFLGDDAFGVEVARRLQQRVLPPDVKVLDFGIRSYDLAFAILDEPMATILVDAVPRGGPPGTLYLLELNMEDVDSFTAVPDAHSMNPVAALQLVKQYGGPGATWQQLIYLVGCEPATLEPSNGSFGLSEPVEAAVDGAIEMVEEAVQELKNAQKSDSGYRKSDFS